MIERGEWTGTATQLLVELVAYVRRPVREAEAAYAKATEAGKYADRAEVEKAAADLREAREKARDTLGEGWPKAANALSGKLKRASPALRKAGIVIEWPTRHDDLEDDQNQVAKNQRESRTDRPEPPKRPPQEATSNRFNGLDNDQAADPSSFRTIPAKAADDLDLVPRISVRTILNPLGRSLGRSSAQPSSGPSALETKDNSSRKTIWPRRTIHAALSLTSDGLIRMSPLRATARTTTIGATAGAGSYDRSRSSSARFRRAVRHHDRRGRRRPFELAVARPDAWPGA